ncbi:hypothetical protein [Aquimarina pacifica]|uniref:hypothetical protein n=1 Tax=Aquimarina pacifica TaxID=1296415 RepID=UPI00047006D3|nr:hypothetical protein [Aquimarina pacifica]
MKRVLLACFVCISFMVCGQENELHIFAIDVEELNMPLMTKSTKFDTEKYQLLEVNLAIDLRQTSLRKKNTMYIETSNNHTIQKNYTLSLSKSRKASGFTISGNDYNLNRKSNYSVKNTAYKDASLYTEFLYYQNNRNRYSTRRF